MFLSEKTLESRQQSPTEALELYLNRAALHASKSVYVYSECLP